MLECSVDEYREIDCANFSTLKHGLRSAAHMRAALDHEFRPNAGMLLGSMVDCLIFTPADFHSRFTVVENLDRRTKEGKALVAHAEAQNKAIVDIDTHRQACNIRQAIQACRTAQKLLSGKAYQRALVWTDQATGVRCKALLDSVIPGLCVCDLKTTAHGAGWREFQRTVAGFHYHMQAAFYVDGWQACAGEALPYTFIVAEAAAPHGVAVYRLDDAAIECGRRLYQHCLRMWAECRTSGQWPGYADELVTLELPKWALAQVPGAVFTGDIQDPF
jgi:exodeoxyribonuclease VIII